MSYAPDPYNGNDLPSLVQYLNLELTKLANLFQQLEISSLKMTILSAAPSKPRSGQIYAADGDNWDPGNGKGLYYYDGEYFPLITPTTSNKIPATTLTLRGYRPKFTNTSQVFRIPAGSLTLTPYAPE